MNQEASESGGWAAVRRAEGGLSTREAQGDDEVMDSVELVADVDRTSEIN